MSLRRFGPLLVGFVLCLVLVSGRLYEVQVVQHEVWARQARSLLRDSETLPARRGSMVDRRGRPVAHDQEVYELEFVWRDFRRENPLGIVTQARSLLEGRVVPLAEARTLLEPWARALIALTPEQLDGFARGEALPVGNLVLPAAPGDGRRARRRAARDAWRASRARHVRFYVESLLDQSKTEARALRGLDSDTWDGRDFASRVAAVREGLRDLPPAEARARLERNVLQALGDADHQFEVLADALDLEEGFDSEAALEDALEAVRTDAEFAVADALFREALELSPRRLSAANLRRLDLEWLRQALVWSPADLDRWIVDRDATWALPPDDPRPPEPEGDQPAIVLRPGDVRPALAPARLAYARLQVLLEADVRRERARAEGEAEVARDRVRENAAATGRLLTVLRAAFDDPGQRDGDRLLDWREEPHWVALERLVQGLEGGEDLPWALTRGVLPCEDPEVRAGRVPPPLRGVQAPEMDEKLADFQRRQEREARGRAVMYALLPGEEDLLPAEDAYALYAFACDRADEWDPGELYPLERLMAAWNRRVQARAGELLDRLATEGPARIETGRVDQAVKERDHLLKDHSMRPRRLEREPAFDLVQAIARHPREHAGFHVRAVQRRMDDVGLPEDLARRLEVTRPPSERGDVGLVEQLVGRVRLPSLVTYLELEPARRARHELFSRDDLSEARWQELARKAGEELRPGQHIGGSGLELAFDEPLSGVNGIRETLGLTERAERGGGSTRLPDHGLDLELTLDLDLQRAAREVIEFPERPVGEEKVDEAWYQAPVGAIVMITPDGEVLAAASAPGRPWGLDKVTRDRMRKADDEVNQVHERVFHRYTTETPGSTFKPFVALHALRYGLQEGDAGFNQSAKLVTCMGGNKDGSQHQHVACHKFWGHGDVDLREALLQSCNAYFAFLGDRLSREELRGLARNFGFHERTGIGDVVFAHDSLGSGYAFEHGGGGDLWNDAVPYTSKNHQRMGNGLTEMDCTPAQVARAYAGLATGSLPRLRLVRRIGGWDPREGLTSEGDPCFPSVDLEAIYGRENFEVVRRHLRGVVADEMGSAHKDGLFARELRYSFACKTGSADMAPITVTDPVTDEEVQHMRKQTWVAGWFPAEDPVAIAVVFVHDTATTSSHGAVQLAAQFLARPEVHAFVERERAREGRDR